MLHVLLFVSAGARAANDGFESVPIVDLRLTSNETVPVVLFALRRFGFFYVAHHGVPQELVQEQFAQARALFALPTEVKAAMPFDGTLDIGWLGSGGQALDEETGARDTKEGFMLTNNGVFDPSFNLSQEDPLAGAILYWPPATELPAYESVLRKYTAALTQLNHELNRLLFLGLGLSDASRVALAHQPFTVTKQLRYAPSGEVDATGLGAGAHADWGALTILATDGQPGLEVEHPDGGWLPVPPRDGCLIINAGDQIHHWTNGYLRSANHRVVVADRTRPRYSTAFFTYFDLHAVVTALPQFVKPGQAPLRPPETTREYFHFKLGESTGVTAAALPSAKGDEAACVARDAAPSDSDVQ